MNNDLKESKEKVEEAISNIKDIIECIDKTFSRVTFDRYVRKEEIKENILRLGTAFESYLRSYERYKNSKVLKKGKELNIGDKVLLINDCEQEEEVKIEEIVDAFLIKSTSGGLFTIKKEEEVKVIN